MSLLKNFVAAFILFSISNAYAGFVELGASANYHSSTVTSENYSTSESYTGSLGYYFTESSALEFSYTNGYSKAKTESSTTKAYYTVYGLDFILTFGPKDAVFRPYLKAGGAYVYKEIRYQQAGYPEPLPPVTSCGIAPSAGGGFRLLLSQNLAIKIGAEIWSSPINDTCLPESQQTSTYDNTYRGGISWMF